MTKCVLYLAIAFVVVGEAKGQTKEKGGYETFRLVRTRNIFDPNRVASARTEAPRERQSAPVNRSRSVSLTGTMVTDGKSLAFFGGSRGESGKVLAVGEKVSDFTVKAIAPAQVELEKDGKVTVLAVGRQVAVEGSGGNEEPAPANEAATNGEAPANPETAAAPAPSNDKSEILRRMMERRQQQMSK